MEVANFECDLLDFSRGLTNECRPASDAIRHAEMWKPTSRAASACNQLRGVTDKLLDESAAEWPAPTRKDLNGNGRNRRLVP